MCQPPVPFLDDVPERFAGFEARRELTRAPASISASRPASPALARRMTFFATRLRASWCAPCDQRSQTLSSANSIAAIVRRSNCSAIMVGSRAVPIGNLRRGPSGVGPLGPRTKEEASCAVSSGGYVRESAPVENLRCPLVCALRHVLFPPNMKGRALTPIKGADDPDARQHGVAAVFLRRPAVHTCKTGAMPPGV